MNVRLTKRPPGIWLHGVVAHETGRHDEDSYNAIIPGGYKAPLLVLCEMEDVRFDRSDSVFGCRDTFGSLLIRHLLLGLMPKAQNLNDSSFILGVIPADVHLVAPRLLLRLTAFLGGKAILIHLSWLQQRRDDADVGGNGSHVEEIVC